MANESRLMIAAFIAVVGITLAFAGAYTVITGDGGGNNIETGIESAPIGEQEYQQDTDTDTDDGGDGGSDSTEREEPDTDLVDRELGSNIENIGEQEPEKGYSKKQSVSVSQPLKTQIANNGSLNQREESYNSEQEQANADVEIGDVSDKVSTKVRVQIRTIGTGNDAIAKYITNHGGSVEYANREVIKATIPISEVKPIAEDDRVVLVQRREQPVVTAVSDGVPAMDADTLHANGITGEGATVVVLDVAFNADHPEFENQVVETWGSKDSLGYGQPGAHGTRVAKVVNDVAPDANLILAPVFSELSMADIYAKIESSDRDIDVVTTSISYAPTDMRIDGESLLKDDIQRAKDAQDFVYTAASGNEGQEDHWGGEYVNNGSGYMQFSSWTGSTLELHSTGRRAGGPIEVVWDGWGSASESDYRIEIVDSDGNVLTSSNTASPRESLWVQPEWPDDISLRIKNVGASGNHEFHIWTTFETGYDLSSTTSRASMMFPATSPETTVVSGMRLSGEEYSSQFYKVSSRGPTIDGRRGVDILAPTGVNNNFYGTSASAPHAAGVAALIDERAPAATPSNRIKAMTKTASTDGISNIYTNKETSTVYGHGKLRADNAIDYFVDVNASYTTTRTVVDAGVKFRFDPTSSTVPEGGIDEYRWDFDNDGSYEATGINVTHTYKTAGNYTPKLTVVSDIGSIGSYKDTVTVEQDEASNERPNARFSFNDEVVETWDKVTANPEASSDPDGEVVDYEFTPAGGYTDTSDWSNIYYYPGERQVTLTVTDNAGATDSITKTVEIVECTNCTNGGIGNGTGPGYTQRTGVAISGVPIGDRACAATNVSSSVDTYFSDAKISIKYIGFAFICIGLIGWVFYKQTSDKHQQAKTLFKNGVVLGVIGFNLVGAMVIIWTMTPAPTC